MRNKCATLTWGSFTPVLLFHASALCYTRLDLLIILSLFHLRFFTRFVSAFNPPTDLNQSDHSMRRLLFFDRPFRLRNSVRDQISLILCRFLLKLLIPLVRLPTKARPQRSTAPFASNVNSSCHETLFESSNVLVRGQRPRDGTTATARGPRDARQQGSGGITDLRAQFRIRGILQIRDVSVFAFCALGTTVQQNIVSQ
jgi:hypothetical protein